MPVTLNGVLEEHPAFTFEQSTTLGPVGQCL